MDVLQFNLENVDDMNTNKRVALRCSFLT